MESTDDRARGWTFHYEEVSAAVWRLCARDKDGRSIESTGLDPDSMKQDAVEVIARWEDRGI